MSKSKAKLPLAYSIILIVCALLVAILVYKQVYLGSQIVANLPQQRFTQGIETCVNGHVRPGLLKSLTAQSPIVKNSFVDVATLLNTVLKGLSSSAVEMKITKNYITEMKITQIEDFFGQNAAIRMAGVIDISASAPILGSMDSSKEYLTTLYKRGNEYYFQQLSVRERDTAQWEDWACAQSFNLE